MSTEMVPYRSGPGGVPEGEMRILWTVRAGLFSLCRLIARNMIVPSLRIALFRLTGIKIGKSIMINMDTRFLDDFIPGLIQIDDGAAIAPNVTFVACSYP